MNHSKETSSSKPQPSILSHDLNQHYIQHGVFGIEEFVTQTYRNHHHPNNHESRFIRLNPRFDESETLRLLTADLIQHATTTSTSNNDMNDNDLIHNDNSDCSTHPSSNKNNNPSIPTTTWSIHTKPIQVPWLSPKLAFYAIPSTYSLAKSELFRKGRIYGMDVSSGAAVAALLLNDHDQDKDVNNNHNGFPKDKGIDDVDDGGGCSSRTTSRTTLNRNVDTDRKNEVSSQTSFRVLDLCCAPGLKTCTIVDLLSKDNYYTNNCTNDFHNQYPKLKEIRVIGVDVSEQRMQLCKNIVHKYHISKDTCSNGNVHHGHGHDNNCVSENRNQNSKEISKKGSQNENQNDLSSHKVKPLKPRISLHCTDGTTYGTTMLNPSSLVFDSTIALEEEGYKGERKRMNKSARARQKKKLRKLVIDEQCQQGKAQQQETISTINTNDGDGEATCHQNELNVTIPKFDRVLVDAECSTDGAVRHMQQRHKKKDSSVAYNPKLTDSKTLTDLVNLQKALINSGFRLLKPGTGALVYSTCSLATEQNEDVVSWLLEQYREEAFIIPVSFTDTYQQTQNKENNKMMTYEGSLDGTVRFHPNVFNREEKVPPSEEKKKIMEQSVLFGGGFFLAKIGRRNLKIKT